MIDIIAFDADDTLWHNESLYASAQEEFRRLVGDHHDPDWLDQQLYETEMGNLALFGYGIKSFVLSMIEAAVDITGGQIEGQKVKALVALAKHMLQAPVELLPHVADVVAQLAPSHTLMVITKGDLLDQQAKVARSGLADYFTYVEVVSEKNERTYASLLARYGIDATRFLMVGNSLRSDILPIVALGAHAVHIPYHITWAHEEVEDHIAADAGYVALEHMGQLPDFLMQVKG